MCCSPDGLIGPAKSMWTISSIFVALVVGLLKGCREDLAIIQASQQVQDKWLAQDVKKVNGVHDLFFVFKGEQGELFNFDAWKFSK